MALPFGIIGGLVGSAISSTVSLFTLKLKNDLEIKRMEHDAAKWTHLEKMQDSKSDAEIAAIEMGAFTAQVTGNMAAMKASIEDQTAATSRAYRIVASILAMVRMVITFALIIAVYVIAIWAINQFKLYAKEELWAGEIIAIAVLSLTTILELCSLSVTWWFGDRSIRRGIQNTSGGVNIPVRSL